MPVTSPFIRDLIDNAKAQLAAQAAAEAEKARQKAEAAEARRLAVCADYCAQIRALLPSYLADNLEVYRDASERDMNKATAEARLVIEGLAPIRLSLYGSPKSMSAPMKIHQIQGYYVPVAFKAFIDGTVSARWASDWAYQPTLENALVEAELQQVAYEQIEAEVAAILAAEAEVVAAWGPPLPADPEPLETLDQKRTRYLESVVRNDPVARAIVDTYCMARDKFAPDPDFW